MTLLERLASELHRPTEPPKGAICANDLSKKTGLKPGRCRQILKEKTDAGELERIKVKVNGIIVPYYIEAK